MQGMTVQQIAAWAAVQAFADERTAYRGHVETNLVRSTGMDDDLHRTVLSSTTNHRER